LGGAPRLSAGAAEGLFRLGIGSMASDGKRVRLPFRLDPEPVNGVFLARCDALDLVCQGATPEAAQAQLAEEAALVIAAAKETGSLGALTERLAGLPDTEAAVTLDL